MFAVAVRLTLIPTRLLVLARFFPGRMRRTARPMRALCAYVVQGQSLRWATRFIPCTRTHISFFLVDPCGVAAGAFC